MIWVTCVDKIRDNNNIIVEYKIADLNGEHRIVSKEALKIAILQGQVEVVNLKLSKDGKLMDRATEEQARLMKNLNLGVVTEADNRAYVKGKMLGAVPTVDEDGITIDWPDADEIMITPNVKYMRNRDKLNNKTIIFTGNNSVEFDINRIYYKKAVIMNPTIIEPFMNHDFRAHITILDFDNINLKALDIIFKYLKQDVDTYWNYGSNGYSYVLVSNKRLDYADVYDKAEQVLKRQKPSDRVNRRCYDLIVYLRFIYSIYLSFNEKTIIKFADPYLKELTIKKPHINTRDNFGRYLSANNIANNKLIDSIENII